MWENTLCGQPVNTSFFLSSMQCTRTSTHVELILCQLLVVMDNDLSYSNGFSKLHVNTASFDIYDWSSSVVTTALEPVESKKILNRYLFHVQSDFQSLWQIHEKKLDEGKILLPHCYRGLSPQSQESVFLELW